MKTLVTALVLLSAVALAAPAPTLAAEPPAESAGQDAPAALAAPAEPDCAEDGAANVLTDIVSFPALEGSLPAPEEMHGWDCNPPTYNCVGCSGGKVKGCTTQWCFYNGSWHSHTSCTSCQNYC